MKSPSTTEHKNYSDLVRFSQIQSDLVRMFGGGQEGGAQCRGFGGRAVNPPAWTCLRQRLRQSGQPLNRVQDVKEQLAFSIGPGGEVVSRR